MKIWLELLSGWYEPKFKECLCSSEHKIRINTTRVVSREVDKPYAVGINVSCQWFMCFQHVVRASVEKFRLVEEQFKAVWKVGDWDVSLLCADYPAYNSVIMIMTTHNEGNVYVANLVRCLDGC